MPSPGQFLHLSIPSLKLSPHRCRPHAGCWGHTGEQDHTALLSKTTVAGRLVSVREMSGSCAKSERCGEGQGSLPEKAALQPSEKDAAELLWAQGQRVR